MNFAGRTAPWATSRHPRQQHRLMLVFCYVVPEAFLGKWISPIIFAIS